MTERFVSPAALPTPHERELLVILAEECGEVVQRATKALRFGLLEVQPGQELTNKVRLAHEIGDLQEMIHQLARAGAIDYQDVEDGRVNKRVHLEKYLQTSPATCGDINGRFRCARPPHTTGFHSFEGRDWL